MIHLITKNFLVMIIDVSVSNDINVTKVTAEKISKYKDLAIKLKRSWNAKKIKIIPIIIGALGTVIDSYSRNVLDISKNLDMTVIQKIAVLGSCHILQHFFFISSIWCASLFALSDRFYISFI